MGTFTHPIRVAPLDGTGSETIDAMVDTGATYTWIPAPILERLGIEPTGRRRLQMANGEIIERGMCQVLITADNETVATMCIFGNHGSRPLLGAVTLEELGMAPDPVRQRLVPVVGYLLAVYRSSEERSSAVSMSTAMPSGRGNATPSFG